MENNTPVIHVLPKRPVVNVQPQRPVVDVLPKRPVVNVQPQRPVVDVIPKRPVVNVQPQRPVVDVQPNQTRPKTRKITDSYVKVPSYWSNSERNNETQFIDITNESQPVKQLVYDLWKPDEVGKGRDAKPTKYKYIRIRKVTRVQNIALYQKYFEGKKMMNRKKKYIRYFKDLPEVANQLPVQTTDLIQRIPDLNNSFLELDVDHDINEHYLFHGTGSIEEVESICREGLSTSYSAHGLFGKGLYTAENPTKSDQFTGKKDESNTLLLLRVCLGEIFVLQDTTDSGSLESPPCRKCYRHKCSKHKHTFDSVVTDVTEMRFRDFVVYRDYRVYPEYIITYDRVSDDSGMRHALQVPSYWSNSERNNKTQFIDITNESQPVKQLVYDLWKPDEVGKGRDAKPTKYKYIRIRKVTRVQNIAMYQKYFEEKKMMNRKKKYIRYFKDLPEVANQLPVQTTDLIQRSPDLNNSFLELDVDHDINEHYLFHGTGSIEEVESICREGLSTSYSAHGLFGKGVYTAENPTKSDQFTGKKDEANTLLLLRVCLGEIFVLQDTTDFGSLESPPCRKCYRHKCSKHKHTFDSVVTDVTEMRFRDFVVYRDYRVYPEYIITYDRVSDDSGMRHALQDPSYWSPGSLYHNVDFVNLTRSESRPIKILVYSLWEPEQVGIGKEAGPRRKKCIRICNVERVQNKALYKEYLDVKKMMQRKENYIEDLTEVLQRNKPVQTTELIKNTPELAQSYLEKDVDHTLNEHYLFHGTKSKYAESICRQGLSTLYATSGRLFGKGAYMAENPTKSDQYTDWTEIGNTILLLRVCLGEIYVQRETKGANKFESPPCRTCYLYSCSDHEHKYKFDSVVTEVKLRYREFVVYQDYRVYPEYIITYDRVSDDSNMRKYIQAKY